MTPAAARRARKRAGRTVLVTGFPAFLARRMLDRLIAEPDLHLITLVRERFVAELESFAAARASTAAGRIEPLVGDVTAMDLGLSGAEVKRLFLEVDEIYHLAAIYHLGVPRREAMRVNVEGTRNVLDLARSMRQLRRLHHFSTAFVSGRRRGEILEADFSARAGFHNHFEESRYQAEAAVRRTMVEMPASIYRPSIIVGDSQTGEIDQFAGPYTYLLAIITSPLDLPLPLPGRADGALHLVPVDYVVEAAFRIGQDPRSEGGTFHLVDPRPLSARRVFELVAEQAGKPPPRGRIPGGRVFWGVVAQLMERLPALGDLLAGPRQIFEQLQHSTCYDTAGTAALLEGTELSCPPFESYVDRLVDFIRRKHERSKREGEQVYDPLY